MHANKNNDLFIGPARAFAHASIWTISQRHMMTHRCRVWNLYGRAKFV